MQNLSSTRLAQLGSAQSGATQHDGTTVCISAYGKYIRIYIYTNTHTCIHGVSRFAKGEDESRGIAATEYFVVARGFAPLRSTRYSELSQ